MPRGQVVGLSPPARIPSVPTLYLIPSHCPFGHTNPPHCVHWTEGTDLFAWIPAITNTCLHNCNSERQEAHSPVSLYTPECKVRAEYCVETRTIYYLARLSHNLSQTLSKTSALGKPEQEKPRHKRLEREAPAGSQLLSQDGDGNCIWQLGLPPPPGCTGRTWLYPSAAESIYSGEQMSEMLTSPLQPSSNWMKMSRPSPETTHHLPSSQLS